jgi:hypothetical protein
MSWSAYTHKPNVPYKSFMRVDRGFGYNFLISDSAATTRKTMPAQKTLPVRSQTTAARRMAGRNMMNKPIITTIITPIMTRIKKNARSLVMLPRTDCRKVRINQNTYYLDIEFLRLISFSYVAAAKQLL